MDNPWLCFMIYSSMLTRFRSPLLFILSVLSTLQAHERITLFAVDLKINSDATLHVQETITVNSTGAAIKHGIVREFPTTYYEYDGLLKYSVPFEVQQVLHNGNPTSWRLETVSNGQKLFIGDANNLIAPGQHTYTIFYSTDRQLGFFKDHDELYWNVTGNGWRLPIDKVEATVTLPHEVPLNEILAIGFTGAQDQRGSNYTQKITERGVLFTSTYSLGTYEGLTIAVMWPKGFVQEPSWWQHKIWWFIADNWILLWAVDGFLLLLLVLIITLVARRRRNKPTEPLAAQTQPPAHMAPSLIGYIKTMNCTPELLAADIMDLALHGFITITHVDDTYTLTSTGKSYQQDLNIPAHYGRILEALFGQAGAQQQGSMLMLTKNNRDHQLQTAYRAVQQATSLHGDTYLTHLKVMPLVGTILVIWLGVLLCGLIFVSTRMWCVTALIYGGMAYLIYRSSRVYTPAGKAIRDHIVGFQRFLTGDIPDKTVRQYEAYLPYAIALGVEQEWYAEFVPLFTKHTQQGHAYMPLWHRRSFFAHHHHNSFTSTFKSSIVAASQVPGKSSGFGGRGRSGGGSGGGGGGGW